MRGPARAAAYLSLRQFPAAVADCDAIIRHCADVATALADLQRVALPPALRLGTHSSPAPVRCQRK